MFHGLLSSRATRLLAGVLCGGVSVCLGAPAGSFTFDSSQTFFKTYCQNCHQGKSAVGGFNVEQLIQAASFRTHSQKWIAANRRVSNGEMPPKGSPAPSIDLREQFVEWVDTSLRAEACSTGVKPVPAPIRRLNRDEYTATMRDLLDIHLDLGQSLPVDGAGGEGFDNAAETLFLSPLHSEKYMDTAKFAMDFAAKEYKSRTKILVAKPGEGVSENDAAQRILEAFLPRAFRRPVQAAEVAPYLALFQVARKNGETFEPAIFFALRGALVSPLFLFRVEPRNTTSEVRPLDQYSLATRLSYFLWGSMPDDFLTDLAASGKLQEPEVLRHLVRRMLRNDRSLGFAQRFVEQWLRTRELSGDKSPDEKLFPDYASDEELRSDIRLQPVMFFRELLVKDMSLLNLIDSTHTIATSNLSKHFNLELPLRPNQRKQPHWVELPDGSRRGGLLGMPAVLAVSSYPYRTSPVLRGAWILDSLLGTPPPPPPPAVPALEETKSGEAPKTVRERLTQHRANPVCASCHSRIDGLGFALENYDAIGRWRDEEAGKAVDNSGALADGTAFAGPDELRAMLLDRKDLMLKNITSKMLGYALGRGLTLSDSCTVEAIVAKLKDNGFRAQTLVEEIVLSVPFRYQAGGQPPREPQKQ